MKILFLDESGDHSLTKIDTQFPVFSLAGCIFDEHEYQENCKSRIDALKIKHFKTTDVILHSREIRKCEPPFNILLNKNTKKTFYEDLNNLMSELPYTIIASAILKQKFKDKYTDPANPYAISLEFVMERFLFFLEENNDVGYICAESRDSKSNTDLLGSFTNIINEGIYENTHIISAARFQKKIQKMTFITKQQNENGHQIADLVAYPIAKYALDPKKENPALNVIKSKFRRKGSKVIGYGLKIFP